jgi:hypothetical protein
MDNSMLTEDIDSSFRAMLNGYRVEYDPTIVSFEEAPPSLYDLFRQRLRWAQGWQEVTQRHAKPAILGKESPLSVRSRFFVFMLLPFREVYYYLAPQSAVAGIVALAKCRFAGECVSYFLLILTVVSLSIPPIIVLCLYLATRSEPKHPELRWKHYVEYLFVMPLFELGKYHVAVYGHVRNFVGFKKWLITKRASTVQAAAAATRTQQFVNTLPAVLTRTQSLAEVVIDDVAEPPSSAQHIAVKAPVSREAPESRVESQTPDEVPAAGSPAEAQRKPILPLSSILRKSSARTIRHSPGSKHLRSVTFANGV